MKSDTGIDFETFHKLSIRSGWRPDEHCVAPEVDGGAGKSDAVIQDANVAFAPEDAAGHAKEACEGTRLATCAVHKPSCPRMKYPVWPNKPSL